MSFDVNPFEPWRPKGEPDKPAPRRERPPEPRPYEPPADTDTDWSRSGSPRRGQDRWRPEPVAPGLRPGQKLALWLLILFPLVGLIFLANLGGQHITRVGGVALVLWI